MRRLIDAAALVAIASFTLVFGAGFLVGLWCGKEPREDPAEGHILGPVKLDAEWRRLIEQAESKHCR